MCGENTLLISFCETLPVADRWKVSETINKMCPPAWSSVALEEIAFIQNGYPFESKYFTTAHGFPVIRIRDVGASDTKTYYSGEFLKDYEYYVVYLGDILIGMDGEFRCRKWVGQPGLLNQRVCRIKPTSPHFDPQFLYIFLQPYLNAVEAVTSSITVKHLSSNTVAQLKLPLPPLNEQRRIVAKIEALKARSQKAKEALEAIPPLLDQFRQSVLAAAFRGDLTADWREKNPNVTPAKELLKRSDHENSSVLPFTWNLASVGDVIESLKYGTSQKCSYDTEGVPVLRIPNISNGTIDRSDLKFAKLPVKEFEELKLVPGDILIIRSNGSVSLVGKSAIVGESEKDFAYAGYLIRLRPNKFLIDSNYLNICLSSYNIRLQIEILARSTSGVHNINSQEVKQLKISLPPIEEQPQIFYRVQTLFKAADQVEQQYQEAKVYLDQLDQSILAKAFRGELVPQDPNNEPASVLLERIQAERTKREAEAKATPKSTGKTTGQRSRKAKQQDLESIQLGLPGLE